MAPACRSPPQAQPSGRYFPAAAGPAPPPSSAGSRRSASRAAPRQREVGPSAAGPATPPGLDASGPRRARGEYWPGGAGLGRGGRPSRLLTPLSQVPGLREKPGAFGLSAPTPEGRAPGSWFPADPPTLRCHRGPRLCASLCASTGSAHHLPAQLSTAGHTHCDYRLNPVSQPSLAPAALPALLRHPQNRTNTKRPAPP